MSKFKEVNKNRLATVLEKGAASSNAELARLEGKKKPSPERNSFLAQVSGQHFLSQPRKSLIDVEGAAEPIFNCFIQTDAHKFTLS